jgi:hypothetical protein
MSISAKCTHGCRNGGICVAPDICQCQNGYEGANCKKGFLSKYEKLKLKFIKSFFHL